MADDAGFAVAEQKQRRGSGDSSLRKLARGFSSPAFDERHLVPMAFNLPFQPGEVLRERAGTNCAHSFRFLSDEQNMVTSVVSTDL